MLYEVITTREIGVRKALGARRRDILLQFLAEGVATCLMGGTVGMALSAAIISLKGPMPLLADFIGEQLAHRVIGRNNFVYHTLYEVIRCISGVTVPASAAS